ncbi:creatininase family protein [Microvirga antarctica]|nr:creatininase family protein [Microvirga antarctica]
MGDPSLGTSEKGAAMTRIVVDSLADVVQSMGR